MFKLKVHKIIYSILGYFILLCLSVFLTYVSVFGINNPDLDNYRSLKDYHETVIIEPVLVFLSRLSNFFGDVVGGDSLAILYFLHICAILFFVIKAMQKIIFSRLILVIAFLTWLFSYGLMHGLIQIRFGLANTMLFYAFCSVLSQGGHQYRTRMISTLGIFTHYSAIFEFFVVNFNRVRVIYIHLIFIGALYLSKTGIIFNVLPGVFMARFSGYLNESLAVISKEVSLISIICYVVLVLSPKLNERRLDNLRMYAALSFIPYFMVPQYEILVRLGIALQYLLIPYLFLTFKLKKAVITTVLIFVFFAYKFYSSVNVLGSYL